MVGAWIEKLSELARVRVISRQVGPLVSIAEMAGEAKVAVVIRPAVLTGNNVLNMKGDVIEVLMNLAVLAAVFCSFSDFPPCVRINHQMSASEICLAFFWRTATTSMALMYAMYSASSL